MSYRGGLGLYPENTLLAFSKSLDSFNLDMIELDLQFSKDQKVIILHDSSIDRTTNGKGIITDFPNFFRGRGIKLYIIYTHFKLKFRYYIDLF